jgi:hypothetical protein
MNIDSCDYGIYCDINNSSQTTYTFDHNGAYSINITNSNNYDAYCAGQYTTLDIYTHTAMSSTSPAKNTGLDANNNEIKETLV